MLGKAGGGEGHNKRRQEMGEQRALHWSLQLTRVRGNSQRVIDWRGEIVGAAAATPTISPPLRPRPIPEPQGHSKPMVAKKKNANRDLLAFGGNLLARYRAQSNFEPPDLM